MPCLEYMGLNDPLQGFTPVLGDDSEVIESNQICSQNVLGMIKIFVHSSE